MNLHTPFLGILAVLFAAIGALSIGLFADPSHGFTPYQAYALGISLGISTTGFSVSFVLMDVEP